jgi:hypothetical protein
VDKLRKLHTDLRQGVVSRTGYANYTVRQAAEDWLRHYRTAARPRRSGVSFWMTLVADANGAGNAGRTVTHHRERSQQQPGVARMYTSPPITADGTARRAAQSVAVTCR